MKILFYPNAINKVSKIMSVCRNLNLDFTNDPSEDCDIAINWNFKTQFENDETVANLNKKVKVINYNCTDVSKGNVAKIFEEVFGYSLAVDNNFVGYCVEKSQRQASHDGKIVRFTGKSEPEKVYQKLIDNRVSVDEIQDMRIPVFNEEIPLIFLKTKKIADTFNNNYSASYTTEICSLISDDEKNKIIEFCKKIGAEYAELDVLRNNSDGKIYIIDVNQIAGNAIFKAFGEKESKFIQNILAQAFKRNFLDVLQPKKELDAVETKETTEQKNNDVTDIVYVYVNSTATEDESEILLSIRSVEKFAKFPFRIVIVGDMPKSLNSDKVLHIPVEQVKGFDYSKSLDAATKLKAIASHPDISTSFVYMYDDIVFLKDVSLENIGQFKALNSFATSESIIYNGGNNNWTELHRKTFEVLQNEKLTLYDGETHLPRLFDKDIVLEIIDKYNLLVTPMLFNSLYLNNILEIIDSPVTLLSEDKTIKAEIYKATTSNNVIDKAIEGKMFLNFNAPAFNKTLKNYLFNMFEQPSSMETIQGN